jgi:hypothetical protein
MGCGESDASDFGGWILGVGVGCWVGLDYIALQW